MKRTIYIAATFILVTFPIYSQNILISDTIFESLKIPKLEQAKSYEAYSADCNDEAEPNNTFAEAQMIYGPTQTCIVGSISNTDTGWYNPFDEEDDLEDLYAITIKSSGLSIEISNFSTSINFPRIALIQFKGNTLIMKEYIVVGYTSSFVFEYPDLEPGSYYLGISLNDDVSTQNSSEYQLILSGDLSEENEIVFIPDINFLNALIDKEVDISGDSLINYSEASEIESLQVNDRNICDIKGIKAFANLRTFECSRNDYLTGIDIAGHTSLTDFVCVFSPRLINVTAANCKSLKKLSCNFNSILANLDVTNCTVLTDLYCGTNQLTELDVSTCSGLRDLRCGGTEITYLDVTNCKEMVSLGCGSNLSSLDVSQNLQLESLSCQQGYSQNKLTELDVSSNTKLKHLSCGWNLLIHLDLSNNIALEQLYCNDNQLESLNILNNQALKSVGCNNNGLTHFDVSHNGALRRLNCSDNQLTSLDVSGNYALRSLECAGNLLTSLDLSFNCDLALEPDRSFYPDLDISNMESLYKVCVWALPFPPDNFDLLMTGSPNVYFADCLPPQLVTTDTIFNSQGIEVTCTEDGVIYLVPENTDKDLAIIRETCMDSIVSIANVPLTISTSGLDNGVYWLYAKDSSGNLSEHHVFTIIPVLDLIPPELFISEDTLYQHDFIQVTSTEDGMIYLVPENTEKDLSDIRGVCIDSVEAVASTPVNVSLYGLENGIFRLYARDSTGNLSEAEGFTIMGVGVEHKLAEQIRIYPNPFNSIITIETALSGQYIVNITSLKGQLIFDKKMEGTSHQIDISAFQKGVYLITIRSKDFVTTEKIIKL